MNRQPSTNVVLFKRQNSAPMPGCAKSECVKLAMAEALGVFRNSVTGKVVHGRAYLNGQIASASDRQWVEESVCRLNCVLDVINDVVVEHPHLPQPSKAPARRDDVVRSQQLLYLSSYCSLDKKALETLIDKTIATLAEQLDELDAKPAKQAVIFYYCWRDDATMIDVALPAINALERRLTNSVRGTILPTTTRWVRPRGGLKGLKAARLLLASRCGFTASDPLFRVWQIVPLSDSALPTDWLEMPVYTAH